MCVCLSVCMSCHSCHFASFFCFVCAPIVSLYLRLSLFVCLFVCPSATKNSLKQTLSVIDIAILQLWKPVVISHRRRYHQILPSDCLLSVHDRIERRILQFMENNHFLTWILVECCKIRKRLIVLSCQLPSLTVYYQSFRF